MTDEPAAPDVPPRKPLSGPVYREFVRVLTQLKEARTYLEIGVHNGSCLAGITCASIGVDPEFVFNREPMGSKPALHLYQMTSDDFFATHDPRRIFGAPVDVAFLDGLHLFEFLLRDFINTERVCHADSMVFLDDCLPVNAEMTERERRPELRKDQETAGWWAGDVWKVIDVLREYRPDLTITPVDCQPTGSIVVTGLDPSSTRLSDAYDEILERFLPLEMDEERFERYWQVNAPLPVTIAVPQLFPQVQVQLTQAGASA